jgi:hypothetical protein
MEEVPAELTTRRVLVMMVVGPAPTVGVGRRVPEPRWPTVAVDGGS